MKRATCVLVLNEQKEILTVSFKDNHQSFNYPGGKNEEDELDIDCAKRETLEETGIKVFDLVPIYAGECNGFYCVTFKAKYIPGEISITENLIAKWSKPEEVLNGKYHDYNYQVLKAARLI